ncbi:ABC transporter permease [Nocardioides sp. YIM 152588]|uniref:ABC transporter permease n=1 Tax=Nocardioides sp. YIM 152588 TaxID=3158259 RepID=UPI0032E3E744
MTTTAQPFHLDVSGTAPVPFWRQVLVELRKSYDTRAGLWLLISIAGLVALVEGFIVVVTVIEGGFIAFSDLAIIAGGITSLLLPVLAILLVTTEWSQRSAMVTFSLEPRRSRVVLAKLVVSVLYVVATLVAMYAIAVVATAICDIAGDGAVSWRVDVSGTVGFALVQVLTMTIGFALGALLLNTPAAIVVFFLYWYLLPIVLFAVGSIREWLGNALEWVNFQAAVAPLGDWQLDTAEEWGKLLVSTALWIGVPMVAGLTRILRAEVK